MRFILLSELKKLTNCWLEMINFADYGDEYDRKGDIQPHGAASGR